MRANFRLQPLSNISQYAVKDLRFVLQATMIIASEEGSAGQACTAAAAIQLTTTMTREFTVA